MCEQMTGSEVLELLAYAEIEPFGALIDDVRAARRDFQFACANTDKQHKPSWEDFIHSEAGPAKPMSEEQVQYMLDAFEAARIDDDQSEDKRSKGPR
jgi:hypothetical protein